MATLFAAFLGYNPIQQLLGVHLLGTLTHAQAAALTGRSFFPHLMSAPCSDALSAAFTFSFIACLAAAWASWLRGGRYHYREEPEDEAAEAAAVGAGGSASAHGAARTKALARQ